MLTLLHNPLCDGGPVAFSSDSVHMPHPVTALKDTSHRTGAIKGADLHNSNATFDMLQLYTPTRLHNLQNERVFHVT